MKIKFGFEIVMITLVIVMVVGIIYLFATVPVCRMEFDSKERAASFENCLKLLPASPQFTHYNDWDEVVSECGKQASINTQRKVCK